MVFPATTAVYAALLALVYLALSGWVVFGRLKSDTLHGDGGDSVMQKRIRTHANFTEYVPLALILIALLESGGAAHALVQTLLAVLLIARLMHPVGMFAPKNAPQQFIFRGGGIVATLFVIGVTAVALLIHWV